MLYMVIERIPAGRAPDVYRRLRDQGRLAPPEVRYLGSWVDLEYRRCFQLMDAPDEEILARWTRNWVDLVEFEIVPVRTSEVAAELIAPEL